jgi:hypothetical protein
LFIASMQYHQEIQRPRSTTCLVPGCVWCVCLHTFFTNRSKTPGLMNRLLRKLGFGTSHTTSNRLCSWPLIETPSKVVKTAYSFARVVFDSPTWGKFSPDSRTVHILWSLYTLLHLSVLGMVTSTMNWTYTEVTDRN